MTYEEIIAATTHHYTEDGFELQTEFSFWKPFNYFKTRWKSANTTIPVLFSFAHEVKEVHFNDNYSQVMVVPNKGLPFPTDAQKKAMVFLFENETALGKTIVDAIFGEYKKLRDYYEEPDDSSFMPKLESSMGLATEIELTQIFILANESEGQSMIGFYFQCRWDEEHGIGVLTHRNNILQTGQLDEARDEHYKIVST